MANQEHVQLIKQGTDAWNQWRQRHPAVRPDLSGSDLTDADLSDADLSHTDLSGANLKNASLTEANLRGANLRGTNLRGAYLCYAHGVTRSQLDSAIADAYTTYPEEFLPIPTFDLHAVFDKSPGHPTELLEGELYSRLSRRNTIHRASSKIQKIKKLFVTCNNLYSVLSHTYKRLCKSLTLRHQLPSSAYHVSNASIANPREIISDTPRRAFRPSDPYEPVEGLGEIVQKLESEGRYRSALGEIFKVLDRDPDNGHALMLAMIVAGESRTAQLQAREPLTPADLYDRRLDPIFAVCSNDRCKASWVPTNCLLAGMAKTISVTNPIGQQCRNCEYVECRECMKSSYVGEGFGVYTKRCPRCGKDAMGVPVYPTGRQPQQMARHRGRVAQVFVFRQGPVPPDAQSMTELIESVSPDVLEDKAELTGIPVFPWPDDIETYALMHLKARQAGGQVLSGSLANIECCHYRDDDDNRIFVVKLMRSVNPSQNLTQYENTSSKTFLGSSSSNYPIDKDIRPTEKDIRSIEEYLQTLFDLDKREEFSKGELKTDNGRICCPTCKYSSEVDEGMIDYRLMCIHCPICMSPIYLNKRNTDDKE